MRIARLLRIPAFSVAGLVATIAGLVGLIWLSVTKPWYDDDVVNQIMPPSYGLPNQLVDETSRVTRIFPAGMSHDATMARLRRNGFACRVRRDREAPQSAVCSRAISAVICSTKYVITLSGGGIEDMKATSQTVCL